MVRHAEGHTFYHKGQLPQIPASVHQLRMRKADGTEGVRVWIDDLAGLLGLVDIGVVELHPWAATVNDIERPDTLIFDLDAGSGIEWPFKAETALALRDLLVTEGFEPWPKSTGGTGLHLMMPIERGMTHKECMPTRCTSPSKSRPEIGASTLRQPGHNIARRLVH